jgi:replicative DNA helicase
MRTDRPLPSAPIAELVTLRSILLDPRALPTVLRIVSPDDFVDEQRRAIYQAALKLEQFGEPVEAVLIAERLRDSPLFSQDPESSMKSVATVLGEIGLSADTSAHAEHYAKIVAKAGQRRRAILQTQDALNQLWDTDDATSVLTALHSDIEDLQRASQIEQVTTEDLFNRWSQGILERQPQQLFECGPYGSEIGKFSFGPETVTMIGAPPAAGKTAFCGQVVFDALRIEGQESLRLLIANVEMSVAALLTRQLARYSGISYSYLHHRDYCVDAQPRIEAAIDELRGLMPRVEFMRPPFTLENVRRRVESFDADIVLLDYAQRFTSEGKQTDLRTQTNATMDLCRLLADQGRAVIVVSALSRQKSSGGSTYDSKSMGLASFRESSELEYGSDAAWLLIREPDSDQVELKCVKNRAGKLCSLQLLFDGSRQQFRDDPNATEWNP